MAPLKNIRHEKLAHAIVENPESNSQAYLKVYKVKDNHVAGSAVSRTLENVDIRRRIQEIMREKQLSESNCIDKLSKFTNSENENIGLDATKTALKIYGAFEEPKDSASNIDGIEVNINIVNLT